jgi:3-phenylpropionate/trans-cinnamate dioxygenase ferredoxin component
MISKTVRYEFHRLTKTSDLPPGERLYVEIEEQPIVLFNIGGEIYAMGDVCTHDEGPLGDGELDGCEIACPRHGARFDVRTGEALTLPAVEPSPTYPVQVVDGYIEIGIPA